MSNKNLSTATVAANEIAKAVDFIYANDQSITNISVALQAVLAHGDYDYVIGGKVQPYPAGGMNFVTSPIFGHCQSSGVDVIEGVTASQPTSVEVASATLDRLDTVQIRGKETPAEFQQRKFKDPETGTISTKTMATKKIIEIEIAVKRGADGSVAAPLADAGWIKLAELFIPARTVSITEANIRNITARASGEENNEWTNDKTRTFNPGYLTDIIAKFLRAHKEDGTHKDGIIDAKKIVFGIEENDINGNSIPVGRSVNIVGTSYTPQLSVSSIIASLAAAVSQVYSYANDLLGKYNYTDILPVAASTANVNITAGGEMVIDGIACTAGQMVFLKDQTDKKQNGYWKVQTGAWNRYTGYGVENPGCFNNKFILVKAGTTNGGKIYFLKQDVTEIGNADMVFIESIFSPHGLPGKVLITDNNGKAKASTPSESSDIARKKEIDDLQAYIHNFIGGEQANSLVRPGRNLLEVFDVSTVQEVMEILHDKCNGEGIPDFSGIQIGDYVDLPSLTVDGTVYTQNLRILVSGFNTFRNPLNKYGAQNIKNHILFTFDSIVLKRRMNPTNNNAGGYPASELRIFLEGATGDGSGPFAIGLKNAIGNYLYTVRRYTSTKGAMAWNNYTVFLPTEKEVGADFYYDHTAIYPGDEKDDYDLQLRWQIYNVRPFQKQYNGKWDSWWWISTPWQNGSTYFSAVYNFGVLHYNIASNTDGGVAPAFCIA
jgi:hypothetical protein